jgi:hypothetical protein
MTMATEAPFDPTHPDEPFVLKPWKDPAALRALRTYAQSCYPELRAELETWIREIEAGPVLRGDVGRRNEPYAAPAPPAPRRPAARRAKTAPARRRARKPGRTAARPKKRRR